MDCCGRKLGFLGADLAEAEAVRHVKPQPASIDGTRDGGGTRASIPPPPRLFAGCVSCRYLGGVFAVLWQDLAKGVLQGEDVLVGDRRGLFPTMAPHDSNGVRSCEHGISWISVLFVVEDHYGTQCPWTPLRVMDQPVWTEQDGNLLPAPPSIWELRWDQTGSFGTLV
jgi:hypothetical protein